MIDWGTITTITAISVGALCVFCHYIIVLNASKKRKGSHISRT